MAAPARRFWLIRATAARLVACALIAAPGSAAAASGGTAFSPMVFQHLTQQDGLSQNTVNATFQDSEGFLWLATENGLNRYDGYRVHRYLRAPAASGDLPSDFVWAIAEDRHDDLWLATEGAGIVRWSREQDRFESMVPREAGPLGAARRLARSLCIDRDGAIWVGTRGGGILVLDSAGKLLRTWENQAGVASSLGSNVVTAIVGTRDGAIWAGTDHGLDRLAAGASTWQHFARDAGPGARLADDEILSLLEDRDGTLWVGTFGGGLHRWLGPDAGFQHFGAGSAPDALSGNEVRAIFEDAQRRLWVGTGSGLDLFDRFTGRFSHARHEPSDPFSLSDSYVMSIAQDRTGLLWVGTRGAGVNRWNPRSWALGLVEPAELSGSNLSSFATFRDESELWIGTMSQGLLHGDRNGSGLRSFGPRNGDPALSSGQVMSLLAAADGTLWIGTMDGGLDRLDRVNRRVDVLRHDPSRPASLPADGIMSLLQSRDGTVWVGTFGGGVASVNPKTLEVRRFGDAAAADSPALARAAALAEGSDGRIWVGTDGEGLARLDPVSGTIERFPHDPDSESALAADAVYALAVDGADTLWIGTGGGGLAFLEHASAATPSSAFRHLGPADGLSSNVVYGILPGADGSLWMSSNNGLMSLDPATRTARSFHRAHGLQGDEFNFGAFHAADDGRLFFGGASGYNGFDPREIHGDAVPPELRLVGVEKFNRPAQLAVPAERLRRLQLGYDDRMVTFEFAALDYTAPEANQYSFKLEGLDSKWTEPGPQRRATYTNLDPGDYRLLVRAANSDGVWTATPLAVSLQVSGPPWTTWYAYTTYAVACVLALLLLLRWRTRRIEYDARFRQLAYYDPVTGLPNLQLFQQRADAALARARSSATPLAILCIHVRQPYRPLAQHATDEVLRAFGSRLAHLVHGGVRTVEAQDVARLGGNSFVAYFGGEQAATAVERLASQLIGPEDGTAWLGGDGSPALGLASFPEHGDSSAELVAHADIAASEALVLRRKGLVQYETMMTERARDRSHLERDLRRAIENRELELHFQPKYDMHHRLTGSEALLRWRHAERGFVPPSLFIALAEEVGLIGAIDDFVIDTAARTLRGWSDRALPCVPVAINISAEDVTTGRVVRVLSDAVQRHGIEARMLEIEITESALLRDVDQCAAALREIKKAGHGLVLDDFGTGYSSLTHLQSFPIDCVKIDRTFVISANDRDGASVCRAIMALARSLRLRTVAEGVETQAQMESMRILGCDEIQGWLLGRAMPPHEFEELLLGTGAQLSRFGDRF